VSVRALVAAYLTVVGGVAATAVASAAWGWPAWGLAAWAATGVVGAAAVEIGVRRHRPRRAQPWRLLAVAIVVSAGGDLLAATSVPDGIAVAASFAMLPVAVAALAALGRSGSSRHGRARFVDALTVTVATLLVAWVAVVNRTDAPHADKVAMIAWSVADLLLLALIVRLLGSAVRLRAGALLTAGALAAVIANGLHGFSATTGTGGPGLAVMVGWLASYVLWGVAALHPSMSQLTDPRRPSERRHTAIGRWMAIALVSLVAPAMLLVEALTGPVRDGPALAVASAIIFVLGLVSVAADAANARVRPSADREQVDELTGLADRTRFTGRLRDATAAGQPGGVILIDLDDFTSLNDTLGPSVGDEVLVTVARRLARTAGRHDLVARFGADEFAFLVHAAALDRVSALVADIRTALEEPVPLVGRSVTVTASMGLAATDDGDGDPLSRASLALRAARAEGRGQLRRYQPELHEPMVERMRLRTALARAVAEREFSLRYQPIVALGDGETVGFEALVRWDDPENGPVGPAEFIAVAEEIGLIEEIGDWVLRRAVTAAAHWHRAIPPGPYVSVNVSVHQLRVPGFADRVDRELVTAGLPPANLMLELTESVLLREDDAVWAELAALRDTGIRLAIDDFGTGYSSLSYLVQTPIDVIKIDKSFIGRLSSSRQRAIVDGVVRLADTLGLDVVAEGIETAAVRDVLAAMGCPFGQGFLYAAPLTSAETTRWLLDGPGAGEYAHSGVAPTEPGTLPR
jgi:diguanylate cyclase (GGDEF)-like protein